MCGAPVRSSAGLPSSWKGVAFVAEAIVLPRTVFSIVPRTTLTSTRLRTPMRDGPCRLVQERDVHARLELLLEDPVGRAEDARRAHGQLEILARACQRDARAELQPASVGAELREPGDGRDLDVAQAEVSSTRSRRVARDRQRGRGHEQEQREREQRDAPPAAAPRARPLRRPRARAAQAAGASGKPSASARRSCSSVMPLPPARRAAARAPAPCATSRCRARCRARPPSPARRGRARSGTRSRCGRARAGRRAPRAAARRSAPAHRAAGGCQRSSPAARSARPSRRRRLRTRLRASLATIASSQGGTRRPPEAPQREPGAHERLLRGLLGVGRRARDQICGAESDRLVLLDEGFVGARVATPRAHGAVIRRLVPAVHSPLLHLGGAPGSGSVAVRARAGAAARSRSIWAWVITMAVTVRSFRVRTSRMRWISSPGSTTIAWRVVSSPKIEQLH